MLDVAIVGGGLCGLALAHSLQARDRDWRLFEARDRLGGRVLTATAADGTPVDLGATWFWPDTQPAIARVVDDLGLRSFDQLDDGRVLHLADPNRAAQAVALTDQLAPAEDPAAPASPGAVHGGARRVFGGMGAVVAALARPLPGSRMRLGHVLEAVVDHGEYVEVHLRCGAEAYSISARHVVLAMPPRVVESGIAFTPALAAEVASALRATPTWMATAAKAGFAYSRAFWHEKGLTGNAWVSHSQAMLAEVFDASGPMDGPARYAGAALAGLSALDIDTRASFSRGRDLLLDSQMTMLFGAEAADPALNPERFWQDWASEPVTCSPTDASEQALAGTHPRYGDPLLARPHWGGRLLFGASETARMGGGYLEGALAAAGRLRGQLTAPGAALARPGTAANDAACALDQERVTALVIWIQEERANGAACYRELVHAALMRQDDMLLTQRAVVGALQALYAEALQRLDRVPAAAGAPVSRHECAALVERLRQPFADLGDDVLAEAVIFNGSSCALSSFEAEHRPSGAYVRAIRAELGRAWQAFAVAATRRLQARAGGPVAA